MEGKIYCLLTTGKPLTRAAQDALLLNALDMWDEKRHQQQIKSRGYDGVINSDLEVIDYLGVPSVIFEAMVATDKWGATDVRFCVRIDDLEGVELGTWGSIGGDGAESLFELLREGKNQDDQ
jgi:hypothetical protein